MELTEGGRELLRDGISQKIPGQNFDEEEPPGPHLPTLVLLLMNSRHPSNSLESPALHIKKNCVFYHNLQISRSVDPWT